MSNEHQPPASQPEQPNQQPETTTNTNEPASINPEREAQLAQDLANLLQSIAEKTGVPIPDQPRPWLGR